MSTNVVQKRVKLNIPLNIEKQKFYLNFHLKIKK